MAGPLPPLSALRTFEAAAQRESFAKAAEKPVRIASAVVLFVIIAGVVKQNWDGLGEMFVQAGWAALALNVASMAIGFTTAKLLRLGHPQSVTIGIEVGIQNGTTALLIALTLLDNSEMAVAPAVYSLIMFVTGAIFGVVVNLGGRADSGGASKADA